METSGKRLAEKVVVVIGGTSGLGLSAARAMVREGAKVVVVGRSASQAKIAQEKLGSEGCVLKADAARPQTARKAIQCAIQNFGGCHGLYHVAGGSGRKEGDGPLHQISDKGWKFTLGWNLDSVFYSNRAAIEHFLEEGSGGAILNMTSVLGFSPSPKYFSTHAYSTAKAAIIGLTRTSAAHYAGENIRINAIAPALVETPMSERARQDAQIMKFIASKQPLDGGRISHAGDLDAAVVYFLSDAARFVTGQVLAVDGGWSLTDGQYV